MRAAVEGHEEATAAEAAKVEEVAMVVGGDGQAFDRWQIPWLYRACSS